MFRFPNLLQLELRKLKCSSAVSMDLYESLWLKSIYVICETQIIWKNIWVLRLLQVREDTQTRMITSDETFAWILSYLLHSLITDGYWSYHNMPPLTSSPGCTFWSLSVILSLSFNSAFLSLCLLWLCEHWLASFWFWLTLFSLKSDNGHISGGIMQNA